MMINYYEPRLDLTLLGCGFLGSYHLGAIYLLKQIWPQKPYNRICGASCGGLLGALLIAGLHIDVVLKMAMQIIKQFRCYLRNPKHFQPVKDLVEQALDKLLPPDAHKLCSDKLGISVTKFSGFNGRNKFISEFHSRRDLIEAICAGCFIPIWSGSFRGPEFRGEKSYIDGAYSNNTPKFELAHHITSNNNYDASKSSMLFGNTAIRQVELSPFAGDVDVSPKDIGYLTKLRCFGTVYLFNWNNVFVRSSHAMFPFKPKTYLPYLMGGHCDMKDFLLKNNMIKCKECYEQQQQYIWGDTFTCADVFVNDNANDHGDTIDNGTSPGHDKYLSFNSVKNNQPTKKSCLICLRLLEKVDSLEIPEDMRDIMN